MSGLARTERSIVGLLTRSRQPPTHPAQERVAQLVEHLTFNQVVLGSSPSALTNNIKGLHKFWAFGRFRIAVGAASQVIAVTSARVGISPAMVPSLKS